ncbi:hypothetical protein D9M69_447120 [compost metagenome]
MTQWRVAQHQGDQDFELLVCSPAAQRELFEAARQLYIATNGLAGVIDPEANERDLKAVAQKTQRIEHDALLAICSSEDVMHLVDH